MLPALIRHRHRTEKRRAQALVELALVMPVLVGIIVILFQVGILFISYLSVVHMTRDVARWLTVHPDTLDGAKGDCLAPNVAPFYTAANRTLYRRMCDDAPGVIDYKNVTITILPGYVQTPAQAARTCTSTLPCASRPAGAELRIQLKYDASSAVFLPASYHFGPFINVDLNTNLPPYEYSLMVEPH